MATCPLFEGHILKSLIHNKSVTKYIYWGDEKSYHVLLDFTNHPSYKSNIQENVSLLLFISYKFVKGFLAITFLLLLISIGNFHNVWQRFLYSQKPNFSMIRQKRGNFPLTHIMKITHFCNVMSIDMTLQNLAIFYNWGIWGKSLSFVGSSWNFVPGYIKTVDTHHESFR